jgi:hypothetical protein
MSISLTGSGFWLRDIFRLWPQIPKERGSVWEGAFIRSLETGQTVLRYGVNTEARHSLTVVPLESGSMSTAPLCNK